MIFAGLAIAMVPFALSDTVNGAIIAGIFSVVNTVLNLRLIKVARETKKQVSAVQATAVEAKEEMHSHLESRAPNGRD